MSMRHPQVRTQSFIPYICYIYTLYFRIVLGFSSLGNLTQYNFALCSFFSSDRNFASSFLQIPFHNGHPCSWLCTWHYQPVLRTFTCWIMTMLGTPILKDRKLHFLPSEVNYSLKQISLPNQSPTDTIFKI
jgi:hypothetical protein